MEAPLPKNEKARLEALNQYRILDTPAERDFDDLVRLAAHICETPISLVSLVDRDRQWFKGRYGMNVSETPRKLSFCAYTILDAEKLMVVPDAQADPRFSDNELVQAGPRIRAYAAAPLVTPQGDALGTLCVIDTKPRDFTAVQRETIQVLGRQVQNQLELRRSLFQLNHTSQQLIEANKNLQAFANSAAHDLRSPLRAINSFTQVALDECGQQLGEVGRSLLERVLHATCQMSQLLNDLLEYSRMNQSELLPARVSLQAALRDAMEVVQQEIESRKPSVDVAGILPDVAGHHATIVLIISNFLSNSLKFVRPDSVPQIRIWAELQGDFTRLSVQDNGIGIPNEQQDKVFAMFTRLHGKNAFPGTGLGLAIVKRAAERMRGRVGFQSTPGQGSCFWVELPLYQNP